jgi:protein-S-isoprenylcysteine O-methyltransferase
MDSKKPGKNYSLPPVIGHAAKLLGVLVLLLYEDLVVILWPGGPLRDIKALLVVVIADLAIGFDVFIRPTLVGGQKDQYATWKVYFFFVASPLLLGGPWVERLLLARGYQAAWLLDILFVAGLVLVVGGGLLLAWARLTLGRLGSPKVLIQDGHRLITTGPYRRLRNPMYTADLLLYAGVAIALGAWISLVLAIAALLPMLVGRAKLEERLLVERFGEEYRAWAAKSWRLIPFLW